MRTPKKLAGFIFFRSGRRIGACLLLALLFALPGPGMGAPLGRQSAPVFSQAIALPAYFPLTAQGASDWTSMVNAAPVAALAVANSNNGPDDGSGGTNPTWSARITAAQQAGMNLVGYVYTSYTARSIDSVKTDIDHWYAWYPQMDGIFVDEVTTNAADAQAPSGYYAQLYAYIKAKPGKGIVVANPGTQGPEVFMSVCDIYVNFENDNAQVPYSAFTPASWTGAYDPSRFWHLVYNVGTLADLQSVAAASLGKGAGYLFVTDQPGTGNTWGSLPQTPGFWTGELEAVQPLGRWRASNGATSLSYRFQYPNSWDWARAYIDLDRNPGTGFQLSDRNGTMIGADFLIENGNLYQYAGDGTSWAWTFLKSVSQTTGGGGTGFVNFIQWNLAQTDLGSTSAADLVFEVERSGGPRRTGSRYTHSYSASGGPISAYFAENDSTRFYYQATVTRTWSFRHVFIDVDSNATTGYQVGGIGADYLIENGFLYQYAGTGTDWTWVQLGGSNLIQQGHTFSWWVWRTQAAGPSRAGLSFGGATARLVWNGSGGGKAFTTPLYAEAFSP